MKVDILLCIDGTSSMEGVIEDVKANISSFVNNLVKNLNIESEAGIKSTRIKFVVYRNADYDGEFWYQETPFYHVEKSLERLNKFLKNIQADGGSPEITAEDGLMALSNALTSANWNSGKDDLQIIGIWTDAESKALVSGHLMLKEGAPATYEELSDYWVNSFLKGHTNARILLFAPDAYPWNRILQEWPNCIHYKSAKAGLEYDNPEIFLIKNLLANLTPSYEEDSHKSTNEDEIAQREIIKSQGFWAKISGFWNKIKKAVAISFAVLSISLISFRIVGFSIFSINVKYTTSLNDENTEEFKKRLDEITTVLIEEGLLSENTSINYSSEIETRHSWFYDDYDLILRYSVELSVEDYSLGQYSIREMQETITSAEIISDHLNLIQKTYAHSGPIEVKVVGETDASPIRGQIPYNGEAGNILETSFEHNSEKFGFRIKKGEMIRSNVELGVLRACNFWQYIKSATNLFIPKETHLEYIVITNEEFGEAYRKSTIIVRLYDLNNIE